jgi:hypothetical protein
LTDLARILERGAGVFERGLWIAQKPQGAKDFLFGGIGNLEKILVRGERLPSLEEVGVAALDATIIVSAVSALAKEARVASLAAGERNSGRLMAESAYKAISAVGKTSGRVGTIAFLYVAVTRPSLIASVAGWIAEQLGISRLVGIFAAYFIGIVLALQLLWPLIWCGSVTAGLLNRLRPGNRFNRAPAGAPA